MEEETNPPIGDEATIGIVGAPTRPLIVDEDIMSPGLQRDIEALATPLSWILAGFLVFGWIRRLSGQEKAKTQENDASV